MSKLTQKSVNALATALCNNTASEDVAHKLNTADALATQGPVVIAAMIVATAVSQTTDFGALLAGDKVIMIPATAGSADFITVADDGDLGQAAVVGNLYLVLRDFAAPSEDDAVASY